MRRRTWHALAVVIGACSLAGCAAAASVTVKPGGAAWILVAQYRCDLGDLRAATTVSLSVPGVARVFTGPVSPDGHGESMLSHCQGGTGTRARPSPSRRSSQPPGRASAR